MAKLEQAGDEAREATEAALASSSPTSILRRRRKENKTEAETREAKRVRFVEPEHVRLRRERGRVERSNRDGLLIVVTSFRVADEFVSRVVVWVIFVILVLLFFILLHFIYCRTTRHSGYCTQVNNEAHYYYMLLKYYVYLVFSAPGDE